MTVEEQLRLSEIRGISHVLSKYVDGAISCSVKLNNLNQYKNRRERASNHFPDKTIRFPTGASPSANVANFQTTLIALKKCRRNLLFCVSSTSFEMY